MKNKGFTLIEVLVALAIIAIALTALTLATAHVTRITERVEQSTVRHWVAMQAVTAIQTRVIKMDRSAVTHTTPMLNQRWYWQAEVKN